MSFHKLGSSILFLFFSVISFAQEEVPEIERAHSSKWSSETYMVLLIIFAIFTLVLVFRTFKDTTDA